MRTLMLISFFALMGCGTTTPSVTDGAAVTDGEDTDDGGQPTNPLDGACGSIERETITVRGGVELAGGAPAVGAEVWLEERAYSGRGTPEQWGRGTLTDANGRFDFQAVDIISPVGERCWSIVEYHLVAELEKQSASDGATQPVFNAVMFDGIADFSSFPLVLK